MGNNDYAGPTDRIGSRKDHHLKEELCLGQNGDLAPGPCPQFEDRTNSCEILRNQDIEALRKAACVLPLALMAVNEVWLAGRPFQREVHESEVLESLNHARLTSPRIEALYNWIATVAWRIAEYADQGRTRRVCGNCVHFVWHPKGCVVDYRKNAKATDRACEHFEYRHQTVTDETDLALDDHGEYSGKVDAALDAAKVLEVLRTRVKTASDAETSRIYRRQHELVAYMLQEEASVAEAVRYGIREWGVTDQTVRNYLAAVKKIFERPSDSK